MSASGEGLLAASLLSSALLLRRLCRWRAWDGAGGEGKRAPQTAREGQRARGRWQRPRGARAGEESVLTPGEARARRGRSEAAGEERRMNGRREAGEAEKRSEASGREGAPREYGAGE